MKILRTHRRTIGKTTIYVQESPTLWVVSARVEGNRGGTTGLRCKKSEHKTLDDLAAYVANTIRAIYEYENRFGIQRVFCTYAEYLMLKMCYSLSGLTEEEYKLYKTM